MTIYKRIYIVAAAVLSLIFLLNTASDAHTFRLHGMKAQEVLVNPKAAALAEAACRGDISEINSLAHSGADVNYRGKGAFLLSFGRCPVTTTRGCRHY